MSQMLTQVFFFNDTATTEIYTLSLHDALPIYRELKYYKLNNNNIEQIIIIFIISLISLIILAVINIYIMYLNLKKETNKLITVADEFII